MAIRIIQVGMGSWGRDWAKNALPQVEEKEPPCSGRDNLGSVALMTTAVAAVGVERTLPVPAVPTRTG